MDGLVWRVVVARMVAGLRVAVPVHFTAVPVRINVNNLVEIVSIVNVH